jgi:hypothetical protein
MMIMKYKVNWNETKERLTALWNHELIDRPCLAVTAPNGKAISPPAMPSDPRDRWLNPEWVQQSLIATFENTWWGGEAIPSGLLMGGWVLCLGGCPRFEPSTIWFETMAVDMGSPSPFHYTKEDPWVRTYKDLYQGIARLAGKDDFLVGMPCVLPANDLLSMLMGTETFLLNLVEHPAWMKEAILRGAREQLRQVKEFQESIRSHHDFWYGNPGWMKLWGPKPFLATQSDVSCMLSPAMFDEFILPELDLWGETYGALWYHLDGGNACQHLPRLLSLPYLKVVQYVPAPHEPPNGPGHLALYRTIQAAGRIVHIQVAPENVLPLLKSLDPTLLLLETYCQSVAEGEALLEAAKRLKPVKE